MAKFYKPPQLDFGGSGKSSPAGLGYVKNLFADQPTSPYGTTQGSAPAALPDFGQILAGDPFYQAALANLNAQGISDKASRDAALRQAYVRFGDAPTGIDLSFLPADLRSEVSGIISPDVRNLAKQNDTAGLSILARLKDAAQQTAKRTTDVLGSRGLFRSGETGYQFGRNQLYASQANYDATNKFLDYIMGVQAAYVAAERQRQALLLQQQQDAAGRVVPPTNSNNNSNTNHNTNHNTPNPNDPNPNDGTYYPYGPAGDPNFKWNPGPSDPGVTTFKKPPLPYDPYAQFAWGQTGNGGGGYMPQ